MPTLYSSPPSPFGRKVKIGAALAGSAERITVVDADTLDADDPFQRFNPLGKIPVLVLDDGTALFDSRVILEWLDRQAGGGVLIPTGAARFPALVLQAVADGILDAALLSVYEARFRPEPIRHAPWLDRQGAKVARALETLEAAPPGRSDRPHVGQIALACALGYLDLRFEGRWRAAHPRLVAWLDAFAAAVPAFESTRPH